MRAVQIEQYGDASVVTLRTIPAPELQADQVLVEVHAASLNPFDTMVREGYLQASIPLQLPVTLGGDIAGVITAVGSNVTNFTVGDDIYGQANVVAGNSGAFAEYAATAASQISRKPANLDFIQAASLPLVGVSALQALTIHLNLRSGQRIFIHGGSGGIGAVAVQIAKHLGAYVATTATGAGATYVTTLGADEVIDYETSTFTDTLQDYDAVFDTVGGEDFTDTLHVLKPGGVAVSMTAQADEYIAHDRKVTALTQSTHVTTEMLDELRSLVEAGVVTAHVARAYPLAQAAEAFTARESGEVRGKIVLTIHEA